MYYGLQLAASGILTGMYRTDALANNLANIGTVGFKPDTVFTRQRDTARAEDGLYNLPSSALLEKLGAGAHMAPNQVDFGQGPLQITDNDLDLAIQGDGFFVLRDSADGATDAVRFTRDGRFTRDAQQRLVSVATGLPVLGRTNQPILLTGGHRASIDADGNVSQNGVVVGQIRVVDVPDRRQLTRTAGNLFVPSTAAYASRFDAPGRVVQGHLEGSSVSDVSALMEFQNAARSVSGSARVASYHDDLMNRAINVFGRVA